MKSRLHYDGHHHGVATSIREHLNSTSDILTPQTDSILRAMVMRLSRSPYPILRIRYECFTLMLIRYSIPGHEPYHIRRHVGPD